MLKESTLFYIVLFQLPIVTGHFLKQKMNYRYEEKFVMLSLALLLIWEARRNHFVVVLSFTI